jgi:hypothetical protein
MISGEVDLDRAIWDPEYRRRVMNFLSGEAARRRQNSSLGERDRPDASVPVRDLMREKT